MCGYPQFAFWKSNNPCQDLLFPHSHKPHKNTFNRPFAASGHMVHAGGQAAHWDIQNKENSNVS